MDEFARAMVVATTTIAVIVGAVGWTALGWAWGARAGRTGTAARFGAPLAASSAVGLLLVSWTSQLTGMEALIGAGVWATTYVGVACAARALPA